VLNRVGPTYTVVRRPGSFSPVRDKSTSLIPNRVVWQEMRPGSAQSSRTLPARRRAESGLSPAAAGSRIRAWAMTAQPLRRNPRSDSSSPSSSSRCSSLPCSTCCRRDRPNSWSALMPSTAKLDWVYDFAPDRCIDWFDGHVVDRVGRRNARITALRGPGAPSLNTRPRRLHQADEFLTMTVGGVRRAAAGSEIDDDVLTVLGVNLKADDAP